MENTTPNNLKSVNVGDLVDLDYIPKSTFSRAVVTEVTDKGFTVYRPYCHPDKETGAEEVYFNWTDTVLNEVHRVA